jgi:hypothetical protein
MKRRVVSTLVLAACLAWSPAKLAGCGETETIEALAARIAGPKMASGGNRFSVFGRRHNDHTWLEVFDATSATWIPADPAVGVVGIDQWVAARLAFEGRREPVVAAAVPIVKTMLVPIAIVVMGEAREERSSYYLVEAFDRAYGGRLRALPSWSRWVEAVRQLAPLSSGAFAGEVNLHEHAATIAQAADAYDRLRHESVGSNPWGQV